MPTQGPADAEEGFGRPLHHVRAYPTDGAREEDSSTGYLVTPLTITAVYEPEAEE